MRQISATWKLAFQAFCTTCPHLIGEDMKLGLQLPMDTLHSPNGEDPLYSWLATCQSPNGEFLRSLQDKSSFSI